MSLYDQQEARRLLGDFASDGASHSADRTAAARALLDEFVALVKELGGNVRDVTARQKGMIPSVDAAVMVALHSPEWGVLVRLMGEHLSLTHGKNEAFAGASATTLDDFLYNPSTKRLEGKEIEKEIVPVPGELLRRRSALAVLATRVLEQIRET
jgi:hypothetical protein